MVYSMLIKEKDQKRKIIIFPIKKEQIDERTRS
jgi:hypothetical protein